MDTYLQRHCFVSGTFDLKASVIDFNRFNKSLTCCVSGRRAAGSMRWESAREAASVTSCTSSPSLANFADNCTEDPETRDAGQYMMTSHTL